MWDGWEWSEEKAVGLNMPILIILQCKHTKPGFSLNMLVWECINIALVATETRTNKCKCISVNLLVGTGTSDKAFPYVLQEYPACSENHKFV